MVKTKSMLGVVVAVALAVAQVSLVAAAPQLDPLVGTVDSIAEGTDANGNAIIIVNYTDTDGNPQVANLTVDEAVSLGLVTVDANGVITVTPGAVGGPIDLTGIGEEVDPCAPGGEAPEGTPTEGAPTEGELIEGDEDSASGHPVASALCDFFGGAQGLTYDQIMGWHEDGFGFGVIAQALWMAEVQGWDPEAILDAKKGDFSGLEDLPEGVDNWGRLRQYAFGKGTEKVVHNLGEVMSGRAEPLETATPTVEPTPTEISTLTTLSGTTLTVHGKGRGGNHGKGKGHNK